jgi:hypothetical protein
MDQRGGAGGNRKVYEPAKAKGAAWRLKAASHRTYRRAAMALKPYSELVQVNVTKYCDTRKAKDDSGKQIDVPYLNWAKCIELLHEHGAEVVYYTPIKNESGSYVFAHYEAANKDGRKTGCYFVSVLIHIDDKSYQFDMPLMNGALVVYEDTLNQLRISNAHARAFVKGVAIHTGLGFHLWSGERDTDVGADDLSIHNILSIKERTEKLITHVMTKREISENELCAIIGINEKQLKTVMNSFQSIKTLEEKLKYL